MPAFCVKEEIREKAKELATPQEVVMIEGPIYYRNDPFYLVDFVSKGEVKNSLVYDANANLVENSTIEKKILATYSFYEVTREDPLFYSLGDPSFLPKAFDYDVENVKNFMEYCSISDQEKKIVLKSLQDYKVLGKDIEACSSLTNKILNWKNPSRIEIDFKEDIPKARITIVNRTGKLSYEDCIKLTELYDRIYSDYMVFVSDLEAFSSLITVFPEEKRRQKYNLTVTDKDILDEVTALKENGNAMKLEIDSRKKIMGIQEVLREPRSPSYKNYKLLAFVLIILLVTILRLRGKLFFMTLILLLTLSLAIETPEEIMEKQVMDPSKMDLKIYAKGISDSEVRKVLEGYPFMLKGEKVIVDGPYYYESRAYYIFDFKKEGEPPGSVLIVDAIHKRKLPARKIIVRLYRTRYLVNSVKEKPLFIQNETKIKEYALNANDPTISVLLARLAAYIETGKALERSLVGYPSFENARELARTYFRTEKTLETLEKILNEEKVSNMTQGLNRESPFLKGRYQLITQIMADEYYYTSKGRYRTRSISRIPLMKDLARTGSKPSDIQLLHDLTSDLVYDSKFLWFAGKPARKSMFVRMPRKFGEITNLTF
ncbi:MAG: hypothetical protein ACE5K4_05610 [Candidatus Hydrothermarchaeota archaeon]